MSRQIALQVRFVVWSLAAVGLAANWPLTAAGAEPEFQVAVFQADVTPRLGHPLLGSHCGPAKSIDDPLFAHGFVLLGSGKPIVLTAVDWCEIRNDAYERWRSVLAEAAGTTIDRVVFSSVHQHDAPLADLEAERLLEQQLAPGKLVDLEFHEYCVQKVAGALRESLKSPRKVTQLGLGQAKVEGVASNRRVVMPDGKASFPRMSATRNPELRALPDGTIDPWLKTLSLWDGDQAIVAISSYSTHPMSYYGNGEVSSDFVGLARARRQKDDAAVHQIYLSGCSGDITAGKYNDGSHENRAVLTEKMYQGMVKAWEATKRVPLTQVECRAVPLLLPHRETPGLTEEDLRKQLTDASKPFYPRVLAAMGLSSRKRNSAGHQLDVQAIDFGAAQMVLLPGESFVAYQLMAQKLRPDSFVMAIGYGESSPGYIPTDEAFREGYFQQHGWCWVANGAEPRIAEALRKVLNAK
jgi:hypothetical protein